MTLKGSQGDSELTELETPESILEASKGLPMGPACNIGRHYKSFVEAIHKDERFESDFGTALEAHKLLELLKQSPEEGRTIQLN